MSVVERTAVPSSALPARTEESPFDREALVRLLLRHASVDGPNPTVLAGVEVLRSTRPRARMPVVSQPALCIVAQGSKRTFLGDEVYTYDPFHYLVLSVPLPIEGEIVEASVEKPYLSLRISVDPLLLGELLYDLGAAGEGCVSATSSPVRRGIFVSRLDGRLLGSIVRLLGALEHPLDPRILGRELLRETLYHVLVGEQGGLLRSVAVANSRAHRLAGVLRYLQTHFAEPLDISRLAAQAGMSPTTLHHQFRAMTATSPIQYLKSIRLHQALRLMLHEGLGAAEAAFRVGYGSPSQFSREFKRLFGATPRREVARLVSEASI